MTEIGETGEMGRKWNRPRTLRTNERGVNGVFSRVDEAEETGTLGWLLSDTRREETRSREEDDMDDGGEGRGDGARS